MGELVSIVAVVAALALLWAIKQTLVSIQDDVRDLRDRLPGSDATGDSSAGAGGSAP